MNILTFLYKIVDELDCQASYLRQLANGDSFSSEDLFDIADSLEGLQEEINNYTYQLDE